MRCGQGAFECDAELAAGMAKSAIEQVRRLQTAVSWRTQSRSGLGRVAGVNGSTY